MQLVSGLYNTVINVKEAEDKLDRSMINGELTSSVLEHVSNQNFYIPYSKDVLLTTVISKISIKLRCLVLTLIAIPLEANWIRLRALLHLVDDNNGERMLASRTYTHNVDTKPLYVSSSTKGLHYIRGKDAGQTQQQHPACLGNAAKLELVLGPNLRCKIKKIAAASLEEATSVILLGNGSSALQHFSSILCLDSFSADNLSDLNEDSSELYTNKTISRSTGCWKICLNDAIAVASKEGATGFNLCRSCEAETMLFTRTGAPLASELLGVSTSPSGSFNGISGNHIVKNTPSQINSLTSLSQSAHDPEVIAIAKAEPFPSHYLCISNQIQEAINMNCIFVDRKYGQVFDLMKVTQAIGARARNQVSGNSSDHSRTKENQRQSDLSVNVWAATFVGQSGPRERECQGLGTGTINCASGMVMNTDVSVSSCTDSRRVSVSGTPTSGSDSICCRIGGKSGRNCSSNSDCRIHSDQCSIGKAEENVTHNDEKSIHHFKIGVNREIPTNLCRSRKQNHVTEQTFLCGTRGTVNISGSESSSSGNNQSLGTMNSNNMDLKGNNCFIWKKVKKRLGDDHVRHSTTIDHVQLNSVNILQSEAHIKPLTTNRSLQLKFPQDSTRRVCNCEEQNFEQHKGHSMLQDDKPLNDISDKFHVSDYQLTVLDASGSKLSLQEKERQNVGNTNLRVTRTRKCIWARKTGFSATEDSKDISQKQDESIMQRPRHPKSVNIETDDRQLSSHLTLHAQQKIHSSVNGMLPISRTSNVAKQSNLQTKPHANDIRISRQLPETQHIVSKRSIRPIVWKARSISFAERGISFEKNIAKLNSSQQVSQKWVAVESKNERPSTTDKAAVDTQDSSIVRRIVEEVTCKENKSASLDVDVSDGSIITKATFKRRMYEVTMGADQSHTQTEIQGCPTEILEETVTNKKDHSDLFCMEVATKSSLPDGSNNMVYKVLQAIHNSYMHQLASEYITKMTGVSLAEFEKVLDAVSPLIVPIPNKQQCCKSNENMFNKSLICNCQFPDIQLKHIWQWYQEPGCYGLEVKAQDLQHSGRLGIDGNLFRAYFVPFLSGIQLFGFSATSASSSAGSHNSGEQERKAQFGKHPIFSDFLPKTSVEADSSVSKCPGLSLGSSANIECGCNAPSQNPYLLFQFFDCEQPYQRRPLFEKIKQLTSSNLGSSSHVFGDPCNLNSARLGDLHPASWYAVAWYPIYRVPEGQLRAAFLTYHSLGRFSHRCACSNPVAGTATGLIAPAVGLQSYSSDSECWFDFRTSYEMFPFESFLPNPTKFQEERLRTLEETATSMSMGLMRAIPLQRSLHSDYEFFRSRRR